MTEPLELKFIYNEGKKTIVITNSCSCNESEMKTVVNAVKELYPDKTKVTRVITIENVNDLSDVGTITGDIAQKLKRTVKLTADLYGAEKGEFTATSDGIITKTPTQKEIQQRGIDQSNKDIDAMSKGKNHSKDDLSSIIPKEDIDKIREAFSVANVTGDASSLSSPSTQMIKSCKNNGIGGGVPGSW